MRQRRVHRKRETGLNWLGAAVAPWTLGLGLLISFTASAGTGSAFTLDAVTQTGSLGIHVVRIGEARLLRANATEAGSGLLNLGSAVWTPGQEPEGFVAAEDEEPSLSDGATPAIPRAVALSSMTPAPAEAVPVEVAAASLALPGFSPRLDRGPVPEAPESVEDAHNRFAGLIDPEQMDREQRCLAEAVYFEARSEPEEGQAAVAQVVLNRVKSGLYPSNVCGVVYQNRHRYMGCQFSFACEGKSLRITDAASWASATRVASAVIAGKTYVSEVGGATHYHATYVRPGWSRRLTKRDAIGRHIFYELKRGQT